MIRKFLLVVVLLTITASSWWLYLSYGRTKDGSLTLYGNVDIREVNLGFRVAGRISELVFDEGDKVRAGEVIARLDDEPFANQVASAKAQVESLQARVKLKETGNRPQEIAQARALVRERGVTAANAERIYSRSAVLFAAKTVSTQDRDNAEAAYKEADARLSSAKENLILLEAGFRSEDVAQARADLAQAEAALATAELQRQDTVLRAPSDGVILTRVQEVGAIVQAGTTVFALSLPEPVWVRAYIHEPDLGTVYPGMSIEIQTDSRPDKPYKGEIGYISPRAEFTPKSVETLELRTALVYRLRIVVTDPDERLRQGMPVTITLAMREQSSSALGK